MGKSHQGRCNQGEQLKQIYRNPIGDLIYIGQKWRGKRDKRAHVQYFCESSRRAFDD